MLYISSHATRRRRAGLIFFLGVAPDGVYTVPLCHHRSGELLPRLFILTILKLKVYIIAVIFCCTFLKVTLTRRYLASLLYGARTFLVRCLSTLLYATIQFTHISILIHLILKVKQFFHKVNVLYIIKLFVFIINSTIGFV